jgi:hypothetical protein
MTYPDVTADFVRDTEVLCAEVSTLSGLIEAAREMRGTNSALVAIEGWVDFFEDDSNVEAYYVRVDVKTLRHTILGAAYRTDAEGWN